jgi:hypothetical protein
VASVQQGGKDSDSGGLQQAAWCWNWRMTVLSGGVKAWRGHGRENKSLEQTDMWAVA